MRTIFPDYIIITLKGMAMGAADVVPGVSGGTVAFISGIYQELLSTINNVDFSFFTIWKKIGFTTAWHHINGSFLMSLLIGIGISILSLSKLITHLLKTHPLLVWAFFFGLVVASIVFVGKQISKWQLASAMFLVVGSILAFFITIAEPTESPEGYFYIFLSGVLGIIAMILPGVSGAFILLLMGSYEIVMSTINDFRSGLLSLNWELLWPAVTKLITFCFGALVGLKLFSKILTWMFAKYKNLTLAILTGFMIGSLNKIWPWKEVISTRINSHGEMVPFVERSILPNAFEGNPQYLGVTLLMLCGFLVIFILEKAATKLTR
jgi:putative membrane protein